MLRDHRSAVSDAVLSRLRALADNGRYSEYRVSQPDGGLWVQTVEGRMREMLGVRHALLCSNATAGLYMALRAAGVGPHDRVLVPGYTMTATAAAVLACGATPVLVDVDPITGLVSPDTLNAAIVEYDGLMPPAACMLVNIHGSVLNAGAYTGMYQDTFQIPIIEDSAQAFMCKSRETGLYAGTQGHFGVFSFKQGKLLSCGEGGLVVTNRDDLAAKLKLVRNHGEVTSAELFGLNFHMTELQAAVLDGEMVGLGGKIQRRYQASRALAKRILASKAARYVPQDVPEAPFIFVLRAAGRAPVPAGFRRGYHTPLCCLPYYKRELRPSCLVGAHRFNHTMMWAPPPETDEDVDRLYAAIEKASDQ